MIMERLMILGLVLLTGLLGLLFGTKKPKYQGMAQCMENPFLHYFTYALAILIIGFAGFIAAIVSTDESAWEEAGVVIVEVFSLMSISAVCLISLGVLMGKHYVYYDREKLILGRVFGRDLTLAWYEISEVRANRNGRRIRLYNREGKRVLNAHGLMTNYDQFSYTVVQNLGNRIMYE